MRQPSWSGWASNQSSLPRWLGVPLLVAVVILASLGWVVLARGTSPADGTVIFPSAPYWSERGIVINDVVPGVSGLRVGDCVVAVDGRPLEDVVRNGLVRIYNVGEVIRYDVRRSDATLNRDCSGQLASIDVTLTPYRFSSVLRKNASVLLLACFMLALGAFLVAVRPRSGAPRALLAAGCLYLFGRTVWPFGIQIVDLATGPRLWPSVIGDTANALFWGALLLMAASLPRQNLPSRMLVIGCFALPLALDLPRIVVALRETNELEKVARLITISSGAAYTIPILMVFAMIFGYRSVAQPDKRAAVRWVLIPFALATFAYYGLGQLPATIAGRPLIPWAWFNGLFILVLSAMTVSVVRNHLFQVQIVIRRWGLRIVAVLTGVVGVLALWRLLIMPRTHPSDWVTAATAGILIALLCVTIAVLNRVLQRRLFGARADSDLMLAALSARTTPVVTDESGLTATLDALMHALRLAFVQLDITMPGMAPLSLSRGASRAPDRVIPLYAGKVHVGQLSLAVRPGLEPLGRADERLLDALSHVLASSAYNLGLQQALRRALAQAVTAREEERRRIRREIHDGIGPLLAAALLRTETAMDVPECQSQAESLQKLHALQITALTDIRSLVEGLRPPALDHGGLLGALQQHAELSAVMGAQGPPSVTFEVAGELSVLPAAVEVAAYRIAQEAMSNATKHADAQRITVRVSRADNGLTVEIDDDGVGFPAATNHSGVGRVSMFERATELGGWYTTEHSPTGGTRVKAWLPILTEELDRERITHSAGEPSAG